MYEVKCCIISSLNGDFSSANILSLLLSLDGMDVKCWKSTSMAGMDASRAYELGLVAKVFDTEEELMSEADMIAEKMLKRSPAALAAVKESIREGMSMDMDSALMAETRIFDRVFSSEERVVRMGRFLEGRKNKKRS